MAAVWGQMSTGGGHAPLTETVSVLGVPVLTKKSFMATRRLLVSHGGESLEECHQKGVISRGGASNRCHR